MGLLERLFGTSNKAPKPGSREEAKRLFVDALFYRMGITEKAKWVGDYVVCPKCGYKFPMSKKQVRKHEHVSGFSSTICPKCDTLLRLP